MVTNATIAGESVEPTARTTPRAAVRDAILDGLSGDLPAAAVEWIEDSGMFVTDRTCLLRGPFGDFYRHEAFSGVGL